MVPVAQWQSASLWMKRLRVRNRPGTPENFHKQFYENFLINRQGKKEF